MKYFKSKQLMAVSLNFVDFKLSYFCDTEVSCSSDCYQQSASAWEGTWIGLMVTSQLSLAVDENCKLAVPLVQRHFASDLSQNILSIFLVFIWYTRQYDLVFLFLQLLFYQRGFICLSASVTFGHLGRQCHNSSVHCGTIGN